VPLPNGTTVPVKQGVHSTYVGAAGDTVSYIVGEVKFEIGYLKAWCATIPRQIQELASKRPTGQAPEGEIFCYTGEGEYFSGSGCQDDSCWELNSFPERPAHHSHNYQAASLADLSKVVSMVSMSLTKTDWNSIMALENIKKLERVVISIAESVAKLDDRLVSSMLGQDFQTKFLNKQAFMIQPCSGADPGNSNCDGDRVFQDGRWIKRKQQECVAFEEPTVMPLLSPGKFWLTNLPNFNFTGIAADLSGWAFLATEKQSLSETLQVTKNGGEGSSFKDISNLGEGIVTAAVHTAFGFPMVMLVALAGGTLCLICTRGRY